MARGLINVGGSGGGLYTATLTTAWVGSSAPYTQTVAVQNITSNDRPIITPVYSSNNAVATTEKINWGYICNAVTNTNSITFTCFEFKPQVAINIQIKVV